MRGYIQRIHRLAHERGLADLSRASENLQKTPGLSSRLLKKSEKHPNPSFRRKPGEAEFS